MLLDEINLMKIIQMDITNNWWDSPWRDGEITRKMRYYAFAGELWVVWILLQKV